VVQASGVMSPDQEEPDSNQRHKPEEGTGVGKQEDFNGIALSKHFAVDAGQWNRQVLPGEFCTQTQQAAVARHAAGSQPYCCVGQRQRSTGKPNQPEDTPPQTRRGLDTEVPTVSE
jgi:hypothetical protein